MKIGIKGKGAEIRWVDENDLEVYKKFGEYIDRTNKKIEGLEKSVVKISKLVSGFEALLQKRIEEWLRQ